MDKQKTFTIAYDSILYACILDSEDLESALQQQEQSAGITIDRGTMTVVSGLTLTDELLDDDVPEWSGSDCGYLSDSKGIAYRYAVRRELNL